MILSKNVMIQIECSWIAGVTSGGGFFLIVTMEESQTA
jgi:hypothetical protein